MAVARTSETPVHGPGLHIERDSLSNMAYGSDNVNGHSLVLYGVHPTGKEIGIGAYGRVFEVDYEGTPCAAKEVHALLLQYARGGALQKIKEDFLRECEIWSTIRHPCVVQFLGSVSEVLAK